MASGVRLTEKAADILLCAGDGKMTAPRAAKFKRDFPRGFGTVKTVPYGAV